MASSNTEGTNGSGDGANTNSEADNNDSNKKTKLHEFQVESDWTLISQGAEAKLWKIPNYLPQLSTWTTTSSSSSSTHALAKQRFSKSYRHPILDERLTKSRCKSEVKCLVKCRRGGVPCPAIYGVVPPVIYMEFVEGQTIRAYLEQQQQQQQQSWVTDQESEKNIKPKQDFSKLAHAMGDLIGRVHNVGVIHGDLTTSNMMLKDNTGNTESGSHSDDYNNIIMIDFGLARVSNNPEELAVDLYVLERALISTHPELSAAFVEKMLASYKATSTKSHQVLHRLGQVRLRGRKRECFG